MTDDALWYEAAHLVGITHALNVVADAPLAALEPAEAAPEAEQVFAEIRAFYGRAVPVAFLRLGGDPGYLTDVWAATRRAFVDNRLTRRLKEALAFAVSVTSRSPFGTTFHLGDAAARRRRAWRHGGARRDPNVLQLHEDRRHAPARVRHARSGAGGLVSRTGRADHAPRPEGVGVCRTD